MTDKKQQYKQFKPDPTAVGEQVNGLMLYVHNRTAQDIVSAVQSLILEPYEQNLELTADQIHIAALQKARDIAKSFIKESITLKK